MYQHLFERAAAGRAVRAGVIGSGQYGTAVVTQAPAIPLLDVSVVAEEDVAAARSAFLRAGAPPEEIIVCDGRGAAMDGMEAGKATIVQDAHTGQVLMLAYMNRQSLQASLDTGETHFWSRSRNELWHKGATSGNTQRIIELRYDCDGDTLLALVEPRGPACHTGQRSCFYRRLDES